MHKVVKFAIGFTVGYVSARIIFDHLDEIKKFFNIGHPEQNKDDEPSNDFKPDPDWKANEEIKKYYWKMTDAYKNPEEEIYTVEQAEDKKVCISNSEKTDDLDKITIVDDTDSLREVVDLKTLNPNNKENYDILVKDGSKEDIANIIQFTIDSFVDRTATSVISYLIFVPEKNQWVKKSYQNSDIIEIKPEYVVTCIGQESFLKFLESRSTMVVRNILFDSIYIVMSHKLN